MPNSWSKIHSRWKHRIFWERSQQIREVSGYSYREKDQNCHPESLKEKGKRNDIYSNLKCQLSPNCLTMSISLFWEEFCSVSVSTFGKDNNQDLRSKIFRAWFIKGTTKFLLDKNSSCTMIRVILEHRSWHDSSHGTHLEHEGKTLGWIAEDSFFLDSNLGSLLALFTAWFGIYINSLFFHLYLFIITLIT